MLSLPNFMANVYEQMLHSKGTVALLCQTPVSPLIVIATVDLSTEGIMTVWLEQPNSHNTLSNTLVFSNDSPLRWACSLKATVLGL